MKIYGALTDEELGRDGFAGKPFPHQFQDLDLALGKFDRLCACLLWLWICVTHFGSLLWQQKWWGRSRQHLFVHSVWSPQNVGGDLERANHAQLSGATACLKPIGDL